MTDTAILLSPFRLRHLTLRNRIVSTAHAPGYGSNSLPTERYIRYHAEKAKGGVALTMCGGSTAVSPDAVAPFGQLTAAEDRAIPHLVALAEAVHAHGAACICQISHPGRRGRWDSGSWLPSVGPSALREPQHRSFPKAMEDWDFERIRDDYASATRRCLAAGLDGVELLFAGGHLLLQFMSPAVNRRDDEHGGSHANRMRFALEVLAAVRQAAGERFVVGVRITADEFIQGGLDQAAALSICRDLAASGEADYLSVMGGQTYDWRSSTLSIPSMAAPMTPYLHLASAIKAAVDIPVLHASRIHDLQSAARAITDGHIDLVAMTRSQIADPHMVRKLEQGRLDEIRPCVGANYCINRIYAGAESLCLHNPATGRESTLPHIIEHAPSSRPVVVVGAGPAGLEAARVCAERGHQVVVFEREAEAGGQIRLAARAGWRAALAGISGWLLQQVRRLGVDLRFGSAADLATVLALAPEIVIVATGGRPNLGEVDGSEFLTSTWDVLSERAVPAESVLLFEDGGMDAGMSCAEYLSERVPRLAVATPERHLGIEVGATTFPVYLEKLYRRGVSFSPDTRLLAVRRQGNRLLARLRNEYTLIEEEREFDQVVVEHGTLPDDELYFALKPHSINGGAVDYQALVAGRAQQLTRNADGRFLLYRVGDAVAGRNIHAALYDSLRLCKDL